MTRIVPVLLVMAAFVGAGVSTQAQRPFPPKSFENLQVLAKGSSTSDVINTMKGFTGALGVRCQHCHVGKEGSPLHSPAGGRRLALQCLMVNPESGSRHPVTNALAEVAGALREIWRGCMSSPTGC